MAAYGSSSGLLSAEILAVRPMGMANAFVSLADDEASLQSNPAGLARHHGLSLSGGQLIGLQGTQVSHLGLTMDLSEGLSFGVQAAYLYDSDVYRNAQGVETGSFLNSNMLGGLGFGYAISPAWRIGAAAKLIRESYAGLATLNAGADLGLQGPLYHRIRFGAVARNLGAGTPIRIQGGFSLPLGLDALRLDIEAEGLPLEHQIRALVGTELGFDIGASNRAAIRAGFASGLSLIESNRLSLGAGISLAGGYALDYALQNLGELGSTHRIALTIRFNENKMLAPRQELSHEAGPPFGLKVIALPDGIRLEWQDQNPATVSYNLYADYGVLIDKLNSRPVTGTSQRFVKVEKGRIYNFYVRPVLADGSEGPSSTVLSYKAP